MDTLEAIRTRRSVRKYTGEPITRQDLETIVDAGRLAPSGFNRQPWEFVVVTEDTMIERLATPVARWMEESGAIISVVMDTTSEFWLEDASAAIENMLLAGTALGYGTCWVEGDALRCEEALKELLGVPVSKRLIALIPVGVPLEWPSVEKKSLEDVLYWERYGAK